MALRSGEWTLQEVNRLSGNVYVACAYRYESGSRNYRNADLKRIPIARPEVCDHGMTLCATVDCLVSWAWDHDLLLHRTGGGRRIAEILDLNPMIDPTEELDHRWYGARTA